MYESIVRYKNGLYGKWAFSLVLVSVLLYLSQKAELPPNGGSWQGYVLGLIGLVIIVLLSWLGIRKRSYQSVVGTVQGWTSAHIYFGLSLIVVATLHSAFQFGYNVHTLAFILMSLVVLSGIYGLIMYSRLPQRMSARRKGKSLNDWLDELDEVDRGVRDIAERCDAEVQSAASNAIERTTFGASYLARLFEVDYSKVMLGGRLVSNSHQGAITRYLAVRIPNTSKRGEAELLQKLLLLFGRRGEIIQHLRFEFASELRLKVWLIFHIPLTAALLCALFAHVVSVFFYW